MRDASDHFDELIDFKHMLVQRLEGDRDLLGDAVDTAAAGGEEA